MTATSVSASTTASTTAPTWQLQFCAAIPGQRRICKYVNIFSVYLGMYSNTYLVYFVWDLAKQKIESNFSFVALMVVE